MFFLLCSYFSTLFLCIHYTLHCPLYFSLPSSTLILGHAKPSVISFTIGYINTVEGDRRSSEGRVGLRIYPMTKK